MNFADHLSRDNIKGSKLHRTFEIMSWPNHNFFKVSQYTGRFDLAVYFSYGTTQRSVVKYMYIYLIPVVDPGYFERGAQKDGGFGFGGLNAFLSFSSFTWHIIKSINNNKNWFFCTFNIFLFLKNDKGVGGFKIRQLFRLIKLQDWWIQLIDNELG